MKRKHVPIRVQRQRKRGTTLPPLTCCCTRPGFWGNALTGRDAAKWFRLWLLYFPDATAWNVRCAARDVGDDVDLAMLAAHGRTGQTYLAALDELRWFKHLACYCRLEDPCHVDTLLELLAK